MRDPFEKLIEEGMMKRIKVQDLISAFKTRDYKSPDYQENQIAAQKEFVLPK